MNHRGQRPLRTVTSILVAMAVLGGGAWGYLDTRAPKPTSPARATGGPATTVGAPTVTFPSPGGVRASWVIAENQRPGSTAWQITGKPAGHVAGFADHVSAQVGDTVTLYVSTDATSFRVDAYRMGYYGGAGARLVWSSGDAPGKNQPPCPRTPGTNMVACDNWSPSVQVPVTPAFAEGDYLLELVGAGGQRSYVPLTVWVPTSRATYLIKNDVYTWQAWNPYGGYDFYAGLGRCPPAVYPLCSRARVVSFDRPYGYADGAGDFLGSEYPLVRFIEAHGLDVAYATDVNIEQDPSLLLDHRALLSLGHDEAWSLGERLAAQAAEAHGVNLAFFAASPVLRHVRPQPSPLGADREVVDYRDSAADPLDHHGDPREVTGNTWSSPPASWPETPFVGEAYGGFLEPGVAPAPFAVVDASAWIYRGTGLHDGSVVPAVLATDFDQFDPGSHPADLEILGHSPIPARQAQTSRHSPYSDMTYYTDPASGAGVFDSGINSWIPALSACTPNAPTCPSTIVGEMTANLLALFGTGPAGRVQPSSPNWRHVYP